MLSCPGQVRVSTSWNWAEVGVRGRAKVSKFFSSLPSVFSLLQRYILTTVHCRKCSQTQDSVDRLSILSSCKFGACALTFVLIKVWVAEPSRSAQGDTHSHPGGGSDIPGPFQKEEEVPTFSVAKALLLLQLVESAFTGQCWKAAIKGCLEWILFEFMNNHRNNILYFCSFKKDLLN